MKLIIKLIMKLVDDTLRWALNDEELPGYFLSSSIGSIPQTDEVYRAVAESLPGIKTEKEL